MGNHYGLRDLAADVITPEQLADAGVKDGDEYVSWMFTAEPTGPGTKDPDIRQRHYKAFLKQMSKSKYEGVDRYAEKLKSYQKTVDVHNENMDLLFNNSPSFFRSTTPEELDDYLETGVVGGDKNNYDFVAMSISPDAVAQFGGSILIEFDGDGVRDAGAEPATYTAQRQPLQHSAIDGEPDPSARREQIGDYMSGELADELEVRMPENIPLEKLGIKNIYVGKWAIRDKDKKLSEDERKKQFTDKYGQLGKINHVELIPESELGFTYDDMIMGRTLEEKGKEREELWKKAKAGDKDALKKIGGLSDWLGGEAIGPHTKEYDYTINMPTTTPEINSINAEAGKDTDPESRLAKSRMGDNLLPQDELDNIIF